MFVTIKKFLRYIQFHLIIKHRYANSYGIPCLCNNVNHPFHESKWEMKICNLVCNFFDPNRVKVPSQHKYPIKFDLIAEQIAIFEPHAFYDTSPENNSYFSYYQDRRKKADKYEDLVSLPLIVISNSTDYDMLDDALKTNPSKKGMQQLSIDLLTLYKEKETILTKTENLKPSSDFIIALIAFSGWIVAIILFIIWFLKL